MDGLTATDVACLLYTLLLGPFAAGVVLTLIFGRKQYHRLQDDISAILRQSDGEEALERIRARMDHAHYNL